MRSGKYDRIDGTMRDASNCGHVGASVAFFWINNICFFVLGVSDGISGAFKTACVTLNTLFRDDLISHAVHLLFQASKREALFACMIKHNIMDVKKIINNIE